MIGTQTGMLGNSFYVKYPESCMVRSWAFSELIKCVKEQGLFSNASDRNQ